MTRTTIPAQPAGLLLSFEKIDGTTGEVLETVAQFVPLSDLTATTLEEDDNGDHA